MGAHRPHGWPAGGGSVIPGAPRAVGAPKGVRGGGARTDFHFKVWESDSKIKKKVELV